MEQEPVQEQAAVQDLTVTTPDGYVIESDTNGYVVIIILMLFIAAMVGIKKFMDWMFGGN